MSSIAGPARSMRSEGLSQFGSRMWDWSFPYSVIMNGRKSMSVELNCTLSPVGAAEQCRAHIRQTCEQPPRSIVRHRREYILIAVKFTGGECTDGDADHR